MSRKFAATALILLTALTLGGCVYEPGYGYGGGYAYAPAPAVVVRPGWGWWGGHGGGWGGGWHGDGGWHH